MSRTSSLIVSAAGLLAAGPAFAHSDHHGEDHHQIDLLRVELHGNLDTRGVLGGGARFEFAVVPDGFIRGNVHDELALSFGADLQVAPVAFGYAYDGRPYVVPIGAVQWNFYVGDWSFFPEVGVAVHVGFDHQGWNDGSGRVYGWIYPELDAGVGARYHFNNSVALLLKVSTPGGLQVGVVF